MLDLLFPDIIIFGIFGLRQLAYNMLNGMLSRWSSGP